GLIPQAVVQLHKVVPIGFVNNSLTLAMVNPSNLVAFDDVRRYVKGVIIEPVVCTEDDFRKFMETVYPTLMNLNSEAKKELLGRAMAERQEKRKEEKRRASFDQQPMESLEELQNEI